MSTILSKIALIFALAAPAQWSHALSLSAYIFEMMSDEEHIARPIGNDTQTLNLYQISGYKIDRPGNHGEHKIIEKNREIIYSPLQLKVERKQQEYFKIFYIGPKDDQERYYRISFVETPLSAYNSPSHANASTFSPSIALSTILIVRPRIQKLKYDMNETTGVLSNTGNTFFRVIIKQGCDGRDEEAKQFYMLPGEQYTHPDLKGNHQKFIVANKKYIPIGSACHQKTK
jgi:Mat/Ecp fimbriae periplasmic chaperone